MAQADSGLGWSAKEEWMVAAANYLLGNMSSISGANMLVCPEAVNWTPEAVIREGVKYGHNNGNNTDNYILSRYGEVLIGFNNQDDYETPIAISTSSSIECMICSKTQAGTVSGTWTFVGSNYDSTTGLYWAKPSSMPRSHIVDVSPYTNRRAMLDAVSVVSADFNKTNQGYAVACIAKWVTSAGVVINTPVLISSVSEYVDMTTTLSGANFSKLNYQYDGIKFYMGFFDTTEADISSDLPFADLTYLPVLALQGVFNVLASETWANILVNETVDPYAPFGNTEEGGGEVNPDPEDDDIEEPAIPGLSFAATGLCRIYRADLAALNQLANYMWTDNTFLQTLVNHAIQLIENPMDAIISLCLVPVAPPSFSVGSAEAVSVMYIPTPAAMWPVVNQFARVDCGTLDLKETYGSALDYNPYTKVSCFLPYIGFVDLDTDEVMGKTLNVVYRIDVVTGVCVAMIKVDGEVMYQFSGHCAIQMPLSSADFSTVISSLLQAGKLVAGAALTAAGAPEVGGMLLDAPQVSQPSTTVRKMVGTERNPSTGRQITTGTVTETIEKTGKPLALGELAKRQSANTVGAIMNSKFGIEHSGGFSGNSGYLGVRRPFIIVKRPRLANPEQYGQYNGRPSMIYLNLGTCTGYTEVQSVQLTGIAATNSELSEIATLLKTGVIL